MAPGNRPDLDRLTAAVDALGTAFADLEVETFTVDCVKQASSQVNRAANMIDGIRADLARKERDLRPPPGTPAPPPGRALDPNGQRPGRQPERDSARSDLFDDLTELGDATRRGDLSGDYADAINHATTRLTQTERDAFVGHHHTALTKKALEMDLHRFRVYVRGLVDDFGRARELERFQQQRRDRSGRMWDDHATGMVNLFAKFDPETGARIRNAINDEIDRLYRARRDDPTDTRSYDQIVADAIANLILGARAAGIAGTELVVLVDLHTLITDTPTTRAATDEGVATANEHASASATAANEHARASAPAATATEDAGVTADDEGAAATEDAGAATAGPDRGRPASGRCCETSDGTSLPIETVRRLACDAGIIPAVLNGHGVVIDFGRAQRLASPDQRKVLETMYPTCVFTDCTIPFQRCEIHHIDPWAAPTFGATNIDRLVPVCQHHHHHIHDHHLHLSLDSDTRTLTVTYADGSTEHHPLPERRRRTVADAGDLPNSA